MRGNALQRLGNAMIALAIVGLGLMIWMLVRGAQLDEPAPELALETCCEAGAGPRRAPLAVIPSDLDGGLAREGEILYGVACANCHDPDGSGDRGRARFPGVVNLTQSSTDTRANAAVVLRGRGQMPAFGGLIDEAELRDLLSFVETLRATPRAAGSAR